jgi:Tfp pilus assembly protein PilP
MRLVAKEQGARKANAAPAARVVKASVPAKRAEAPAVAPREAVNKRDPFAPLINQNKNAGGGLHLPPGKAGLVIATVRVDGAVHSPSGMIAVVSNPENSVYFIREGDRLYDGDVEKIGLDGVTFRENSKDAFGKPVERTVTKRIYASAGAQQ